MRKEEKNLTLPSPLNFGSSSELELFETTSGFEHSEDLRNLNMLGDGWLVFLGKRSKAFLETPAGDTETVTGRGLKRCRLADAVSRSGTEILYQNGSTTHEIFVT